VNGYGLAVQLLHSCLQRAAAELRQARGEEQQRVALAKWKATDAVFESACAAMLASTGGGLPS